jgi:hypothetical protein
MTGKVLDLDKLITEDQLGGIITNFWLDWNMRRQEKVADWAELRRYVYATDTSKTSNSKLPWKNKTTIPKLCQIRDNLYANYMASMFPKRKWLVWEANESGANSKDKREAIQNYMAYVIDQDSFKTEVSKLVLDYIDYGNCFATVEWQDETQQLDDKTKVGYVGPAIKRISPLDIVINPTAPNVISSPKIIRSLVSLGEVKEMLERFGRDDTRPQYEALWAYLKDIRMAARNFTGTTEKSKNDSYRVDGFQSYQAYLTSNYCELLTFYGDYYNPEDDTFHKNQVVVIADRHKVIFKGPNPSYFGHPPIYHCGWRTRQDNLWAMGPLDNLVGMQYRIDHIENLKADVFDLITFPPLKIKGYVEDFVYGPMERIYVGDDGDVSMMAPPFQVLQANQELASLEAKMEEMAGAPKEAMGFRTPGEKTMYEVQRLENAASRIFVNKIAQFEEQLIERLLNAQLELARRNMNPSSIRVFDDEFKLNTFQTLTADDITGNGRIRPVAARHFAEKSEMVQNLNSFFQSPVGQNPAVFQHFSSIAIAKLFEDLLEVQDHELVQPYIQLSEQADGQRLAQAHQQQVAMEAGTPAGISSDDHDADLTGQPPGPPQGQPPQGPPPGLPQGLPQ